MRRLSGWLVFWSLMIHAVASAAPTVSFAPYTNYATANAPWSVAAADLNADGKRDLVVTNYLSNTVSVLLGNGDGTFASAMDFTTGHEPISVAIGDLNGDGKQDLVTGNFFPGDGGFSVLLGNGDGTFGPATTFDANTRTPISVALADLNGDGRLDLVAADPFVGVYVLIGFGNGTFGPIATYSTGSQSAPSSVAIADLNGDGRNDVAVANEGSNTVSVLLGHGDGTLGPTASFTAGNGPRSVAIADVNGDGKKDLAVANVGSNTVSVLLANTTNGFFGFDPALDFATGSNPYSVATGDFDGDGAPDLAVANAGSAPNPGSSVSILLNGGNGTFVAQTFSTGTSPLTVTSADFNNDGAPDLAITAHDMNAVSVLLNTTIEGISLGPLFAQSLTGTNHTLTAKVHDAAATPKQGVQVDFNVTAGPNQGSSATATTGSNGEATFTYSSTSAGIDDISASDGIATSRTVQQEWFMPGTFETCNGVDDNGDGHIDEGFPDHDHDGIADCVDPDDDNDGVPDGQDNCPFTFNPGQADANANGIGDACESTAPPIVNAKSNFEIAVDGQFGPSAAEWTDVTPATFLAGDSKIYASADPGNDAVYLMYDVSQSTRALNVGERVGPVSFQVGAGRSFDVFLIQGGPNTGFGPNPATSAGGAGDGVEVYFNGVPFDNSNGCVRGAVDYNSTSPNFPGIAHNLFELEVEFSGGPVGGCYSREPAFWTATLPTVRPLAELISAAQAADSPTIVSAAFFDIDSSGTTILHPLPEEVAGVPVAHVSSPAVLMTTPNPFADQTSILLTLPTTREVEVSVADISGRLVWRAPRSLMSAGQHRIPWYGRDDAGRHVSAGVYFVRVRDGSGLDLRRTVIRLR